jgi:hypothetical protein
MQCVQRSTFPTDNRGGAADAALLRYSPVELRASCCLGRLAGQNRHTQHTRMHLRACACARAHTHSRLTHTRARALVQPFDCGGRAHTHTFAPDRHVLAHALAQPFECGGAARSVCTASPSNSATRPTIASARHTCPRSLQSKVRRSPLQLIVRANAFSHWTARQFFCVAFDAGWNHIECVDSLIRKAGYKGPITAELRQHLQVTRYQGSKSCVTHEEYLKARAI